MEQNVNQTTEKKKSLWKKVLLIVLFIFIVIIAIVSRNLEKSLRDLIVGLEEKSFKDKAEAYLEDLYKVDFELEEYYVGNDKNFSNVDEDRFKFDKDKNAKAYCFEAYQKDFDVRSFVTAWHYSDTDELKFEEINVSSLIEDGWSYPEMKAVTEKREAVLKKLDLLISNQGEISKSKENSYGIVIDTNKYFIDELLKDGKCYDTLFEATEQVLKEYYSVNEYFEIQILFKDGIVSNNRETESRNLKITVKDIFKNSNVYAARDLLNIVGNLKKYFDITAFKIDTSAEIFINKHEDEVVKSQILTVIKDIDLSQINKDIDIKMYFKDSKKSTDLVYRNTGWRFDD